MLFNSYLFILLFLPLTLAGYYFLSAHRPRLGLLWLLVMSLWFYGYYNPYYLLLIAGSILANFAFSRALSGTRISPTGKKAVLALAVICNIALIFFFKYYDFFIGNVNALFRTSFSLLHLALPLGISFFTLQQLSFVIDAYHGKTKDYSFLEYALFVTYFPQLVAGPIVLHDELIPQFRDLTKKKFDATSFATGVMMFTRGLAKKVLIADWLGQAVDFAYAQGTATTSAEWIIALFAYTFQIYFDFSGYSDMAVGLGRMCNFTLPVNFDSPYQSASVPEFWRRWHVTLGRFLTRYLYIPLGGNRLGTARMLLNTMIVFTVSGIWHGANFTFILWGILHGVLVCLTRVSGTRFEKVPRMIKVALTFLFVNFAWGLFRAESVSQFFMICKKMVTLSDLSVGADFLSLFRVPYLRYVLTMLHVPYTDMTVFALSAVLLFVLASLIAFFCKNNYYRTYRYNAVTLTTTLLLLIFCVVSLGRVSVFLYFNF